MDVKRFLPLGGVAAVAVVVFAVAVLGGNTPGNEAPGAEGAAYYDAHQVREIAAASLLARTRLYRWLGWAALAPGIALFIPFVDFVALVLSGVWILVASVTLFREQAETWSAVAPRMAS